MRKFLYCRPFGVELELNAFDKEVSLRKEIPEGLPYIANLVAKTTRKYFEIRDFGHTHWNNGHGCWVGKPDNSCGIEIASPIMQGWVGLKETCQVVEVFENDNRVQVDQSCSEHLHLDSSDLSNEQIGNILNWWIKCEQVFLDSVPSCRKENKYCQVISSWDWAQGDCFIPSDIIRLLGENKYYSANTFHLFSGARSSLEFRLGEGKLCKDALGTKNWIRLLIHFLETVKDMVPDSLYFLDVADVFKLLGFMEDLSPGMTQIRNWFYARLLKNANKDRVTRTQLVKMPFGKDCQDDYQMQLYDKKYTI